MILHKKEIYDVCESPHIARVVKCGKLESSLLEDEGSRRITFRKICCECGWN
jgi:hypothetical protein